MNSSPAVPTLHTPRLVLSPAVVADVSDLVRHYRHPAVRRFLWDDVLVDPATVEQAVEALGPGARPGLGLWVIRAETDGPLRGSCGLRPDGDAVELLVSLDPERWGRGWATEAARAVLDHAAAHGVPRVIARVDDGNVASARLVRRLGMTGGPHDWSTAL